MTGILLPNLDRPFNISGPSFPSFLPLCRLGCHFMSRFARGKSRPTACGVPQIKLTGTSHVRVPAHAQRTHTSSRFVGLTHFTSQTAREPSSSLPSFLSSWLFECEWLEVKVMKKDTLLPVDRKLLSILALQLRKQRIPKSGKRFLVARKMDV